MCSCLNRLLISYKYSNWILAESNVLFKSDTYLNPAGSVCLCKDSRVQISTPDNIVQYKFKLALLFYEVYLFYAFIACQECSDVRYTIHSISSKTIKSKYNRKTKRKESRRKCQRFKERWYYYFCLDILVRIYQRHLSEVIALSVMSLTHHGRQSRRDYIFGHSIITIRELLTWILAPNREQRF